MGKSTDALRAQSIIKPGHSYSNFTALFSKHSLFGINKFLYSLLSIGDFRGGSKFFEIRRSFEFVFPELSWGVGRGSRIEHAGNL